LKPLPHYNATFRQQDVTQSKNERSLLDFRLCKTWRFY